VAILPTQQMSVLEQPILVVGTTPVLTTALRERLPGLIGLPAKLEDLTATRIRAVIYMPSESAGAACEDLAQIDNVLLRTESTDAVIYVVVPIPVDGPTPALLPAVTNMLHANGHSHVIVRTSTIIGDSRSGAIAEFGDIYQLGMALLRARRPYLPFPAAARVDLIPCDVVADVVIRLVENGFVDGEFWLTGGEHALTVAEAVTELVDAARHAGLPVAELPVRFANTVADGRRPRGALIVESPLPSSLGNRFETALGELGAIGTPALPSARNALRASFGFWAAAQSTAGALVA
jgi:hypothetical protein